MASKAQGRRKRKRPSATEWERRQRQRRAKRHRKRKGKSYNPARYLTRNQEEVAQRLLDGEVTTVCSASWAFFERFLIFLQEVGVFAVLDVDGARFYRQMIDLRLLIMTYGVKILLGIASMNQVPTRLFRDRALLLLIGYTTDQLASGFCKRGYADKQKPMHKNTLANAIEKLTGEELAYILNEAVKRLADCGIFASSRGHFALDSTDLETTPHYNGAGKKRVTRRKRTRSGEYVDIVEYIYGFKLIILYDVHLRLVVAATVAPINHHDSNFTLPVLEQAIENIGADAIRVLLMDRGFLHGETLWTINHDYGIDFVVPAKTDMDVAADARAFRKRRSDGEYLVWAERTGTAPKQNDEVCLFGIKALTSYDYYGDAAHQARINRRDFHPNPLNAIVVTRWQDKDYAIGDEPVFLTTLSVKAPLTVVDAYDLRSLIENCAFRELKQGWLINVFPKKTAEAVHSHVILTLVIFNLTNAYRTHVGQDLAEQGIRRQRLAWETGHKVLVIADQYYAIFDLEEVFILLGCEPQICWTVDPGHVRHRYGLPEFDVALVA